MVTKKKFNEAPTSKTAARSAMKGKKKDEGFLASSDMDRIIPLCGGEWAYVLDPRDGKTFHLEVGSTEWTAFMAPLLADPKHGSRVVAQIQKLGWGDRFMKESPDS